MSKLIINITFKFPTHTQSLSFALAVCIPAEVVGVVAEACLGGWRGGSGLPSTRVLWDSSFQLLTVNYLSLYVIWWTIC